MREMQDIGLQPVREMFHCLIYFIYNMLWTCSNRNVCQLQNQTEGIVSSPTIRMSDWNSASQIENIQI